MIVACPSRSAEATFEPTGQTRPVRCRSCGKIFLPTTAPAATRQKPAREIGEDGIPKHWEPGDVILDLYEVLRSPNRDDGALGQGGMGVVHLVRHRGWNMDLAVKSPLPKTLADAGGAENFVREAETWVNLGLHPNIATCHSCACSAVFRGSSPTTWTVGR